MYLRYRTGKFDDYLSSTVTFVADVTISFVIPAKVTLETKNLNSLLFWSEIQLCVCGRGGLISVCVWNSGVFS